MEIPRRWRLKQLRIESLGAHLLRGNFNPTPMTTFAERNFPDECVKNDNLAAKLENEIINPSKEIWKAAEGSEQLQKLKAREAQICVTTQTVVHESVG